MSSWRDLWEERGRCYPNSDAIKLNGFDHPVGKLSYKQVDFLVKKIVSSLSLTSRDWLLDAGCGAGMLLGPLSAHVRKIVGVDYAPSMVKRCKELFPQVDVTTAEVRNLPFQKDTFDKIVCFSVFQYFPDLEYSKEALAEFIRVCKPGGRVFIGDVPDEKTKAASLNYRQKVGRHAGWHSSIKADLHHIYYKREFFKNFLKTRGIKCMVSQQDIPGYGNSPFRFNVIFENEK